MDATKNVHTHLDTGIEALASLQLPDGSFPSVSVPIGHPFDRGIVFRTTFSTSLILSCLATLPSHENTPLHTIKQNAANFLLKEKSPHGSFNYWAKSSPEYKALRYPDDLDDTFCAWSALCVWDKTLITGAVMSDVVDLLTFVEVREGGPYRTWRISPDADPVWKDVDIAVNANVAYFLSLQGIVLPEVKRYIESAINQSAYTSPYYPSAFPIIYFIARSYRGRRRNKIISFLLSKQTVEGHWGNPLYTALSLCSLHDLSRSNGWVADGARGVDYIASTQKNGMWDAYPFYTGVNPKRDTLHVAGSRALTTAYCLQALWQCRDRQEEKRVQMKKSPEESHLYEDVLRVARDRFSAFPPMMQKEAHRVLSLILGKDEKTRQIVLLPWFVSQTFTKSSSRTIPRDMFVQLGCANVFGWLAYTIFDGFLDDEGNALELPLATIALRELTHIFTHLLPEKTGFAPYFFHIMDQLDQANMWEVAGTRFSPKITVMPPIPDYGAFSQLAHKSLGHGLGGMGLLFYLGHDASSLAVRSMEKFFTHYLIARQLNDDAHDWEKDLALGHINAVGAMILHRAQDKKMSGKIIANKQKLQEIFWLDVVPVVCEEITRQVKEAKKSIRACSPVADYTIYDHLVGGYEDIAKTTQKERENALEFLRRYAPNT